jgi:hypothetical protein
MNLNIDEYEQKVLISAVYLQLSKLSKKQAENTFMSSDHNTMFNLIEGEVELLKKLILLKEIGENYK